MVCDNPFRAIQGGKTKNGKYYPDDIVVPCGQCPPCKKRRISGWLFRLEEEDKYSFSSLFITLTYNPENVPLTGNNLMTLDKTHFQNFMKKLRKCQETKIKYYMCGEYGSKRSRPHYHAIIFNVKDSNNIKICWKHGSIHIGDVSSASISYTAQYIDKKRRIPEHENDDREKEYSNMSNGLGESFLSKEMRRYYQKDKSRLFITQQGGVKIPLPRYYKNRLYTRGQQKDQAESLKDMLYQKDIDNRNKFLLTNPNEDYEEYQDKVRKGRHDSYYRKQKGRDNYS